MNEWKILVNLKKKQKKKHIIILAPTQLSLRFQKKKKKKKKRKKKKKVNVSEEQRILIRILKTIKLHKLFFYMPRNSHLVKIEGKYNLKQWTLISTWPTKQGLLVQYN